MHERTKQKLSITLPGVAQELSERYPQIKAETIRKALALAESGGLTYLHGDESPVFGARSSDGGKVYVVAAGSCTCVARGLCYHRVARGLWLALAHNRTEVAFGDAIAKEEEASNG